MKNLTKFFVCLLVLGVISAMPVEEQKEQQSQIDLVSVESEVEPEADVSLSDDLNRQKRQCE